MSNSMLPRTRSYQYYNTEKISEILDEVASNIKTRDSRIKYLEEENKKLKDETYKDSELTEMKKEYESMRNDLIRGFPISEEEKKHIEEWQLKHEAEAHGRNTLEKRLAGHGAAGGGYTYEFYPCGIGIFGTIKCNCGAKFDFQKAV